MLKELVIFAFISIFLGLSQTAGVGGGPLVNICLMICMGYDAKLSISVTYIFLIGGSVASIWRNSQKINPKTGKTDVNLDLILLTIPSMVSGALFGGIIKNFISQLIITILFIVLFVYLIWDMRRMMIQSNTQPTSLNQKLKNNVQLKEAIMIEPLVESRKVNTDQDYQLSKKKLFFLIKLTIIYYIFTTFVSLIRGGLRYQSIIGLNSCGFSGWFILLLHFAASIYISIKSARDIIQSSKFYSQKQDVSQENVWYFLLGGFTAGLVGATLALGGALILIPVWIKMGITKQVATSSTPTLILISALVAATVAYFNNTYSQISGLTILVYFLLAFASTTIMRQIISDIAIKYKVKQLVIVLLLAVVVISLVVLIPYQGSKMVRNFEKFISFGYLC